MISLYCLPFWLSRGFLHEFMYMPGVPCRRPPEFDKWPLRNYNRYDVRIGRTNLNQHRKGNIVEIGNYLDFDFLIRFLEGLQKFLGEDSEILIHDYRKGYDHTIVYALNADLSGRHVGGSPKGGMITQFGKSIEPLKDSIQTFSNGPKDRFFKSFTTLIPDENGKIIGSVCVNLDVSQLLIAQNALQAFIQHPATDIHTPPATDMDALATKNVDDILQYYMNQAEALVGKPMSLMNKEEKIKVDNKYLQIYKCINEIPHSINEISRLSGKTIAEVNEALFMLEMDGMIKSLPGSEYIINLE